uniref:Uncharacterized protein n=1 Tax=Zosterops lateralis melanops TaxID=1220523 RepID=A0A8D2NWA9_ZOSLA
METRKEMVMFLEGTTLGALVGKRVPNLSEAVGSPAAEPQEKMIHRNCISPRPGPLSSRERGGGGGGGGGGEDEEEVEVLPGTGTVPESRSAAAALLSAGQQPPAPELPSSKGQQSSSDTESDFYEEIEVSCTPDCATGSAEYQHSKGTQLLPIAGGSPCSCLACHSGQSNGLPQRPSGSDFTCSATTRTDSFLTFTPSVLSKATSVSMDQREEVPLTR